jgi:hypothetical protein
MPDLQPNDLIRITHGGELMLARVVAVGRETVVAQVVGPVPILSGRGLAVLTGLCCGVEKERVERVRWVGMVNG